MLPLTEAGTSPSLSAERSVTGFGLAGPVQDRSAERSPICSMPRAGQRRAHTGTKDVTQLVSTIEHTRLSQDSYGALGRGPLGGPVEASGNRARGSECNTNYCT